RYSLFRSGYEKERMQMTIKYDQVTDTIYMIFSDDRVVESEERDKDVIVDYNDKDEVVAVEVLNVKNQTHKIDLPFILKEAS
ncbi:MAG: DUF2283 domain-containing protein, partial [Sulfurovum sp.]|nr:DUF2283 domain-containing protein [Sulfurovum sp.]